ncbi:hypothetical protein B9Z55_004501 [Caenorhabditis nigoni]|uniref:DDHD domain-containing protein n=1 Tax=Caenorhabditis nigoni TaxID=1611254 RepID=A0A2G5UXK5_9PELO|nr:hypothetical protein B9Z55_004501 [Caenorhabditis nigoni]
MDSGKAVRNLQVESVRWHYRDLNEKRWLKFRGRDSIKLEIMYRRKKNLELDDYAKSIEKECFGETNMDDSGEVILSVLNGEYKTNSTFTRVESIYFKKEPKEIRRGCWFAAGFPMNSKLSEQIEEGHCSYVKIKLYGKMTEESSSNQYSVQTCAGEAQWKAPNKVMFYERGERKAVRLHRGFYQKADWEDENEVADLVLVVHGIGHQNKKHLIAENTKKVRDNVVSAMEKFFPDEKSRPMFLPVQWRCSLVLDGGLTDNITIPKMSSMRASLNSTAMDVMYYQSPLFRTEIVREVVAQLNRTYKLFKANNPQFNGHVHIFGHSLGSVICYDVLTQYSPLMLYDKYVTKSIDEYLEKNDSEHTKEARKAMEAMKLAREQLREHMDGGINKLLVTNDEQLNFKVKYLFAVGSPLGVFLTMRGGVSADLLSKATNVERIFNIFHPYDPVAYRLEPFFTPEYKHIRPIKLFSHSDLRARASYADLPMVVYKHYLKKLKNQKTSKNENDDKAADANSGSDDEIDEEDECDSEEDDLYESQKVVVKKGWFSFGSSNNSPKKTQSSAGLQSQGQATSTEQIEVGKEVEAELPLAEKILGSGVRVPHRIDFQLRPAFIEKSYYAVLTTHSAYWSNEDLAMFLANVLNVGICSFLARFFLARF